MSEAQRKWTAAVEGDHLIIGIEVRIPLTGQDNLRALAAADGYDLPGWISWYMNELSREPDELAEDLEKWAAYNRLELATEIVTNAFGETSPWYPSSWNGQQYDQPETEAEYMAQVEKWARAEPGNKDGVGAISQDEANMMRECAVAALAGNGAEAKRLADAVNASWESYDDPAPERHGEEKT